MKKVSALLLALLASSAMAQVQVNGYVKKDGTYVAPTMRSAPDNSQYNNYSTKGNVNPYNGNTGTVEPQPSTVQAPTYTPPPPVKHVPPNRGSMYSR